MISLLIKVKSNKESWKRLEELDINNILFDRISPYLIGDINNLVDAVSAIAISKNENPIVFTNTLIGFALSTKILVNVDPEDLEDTALLEIVVKKKLKRLVYALSEHINLDVNETIEWTVNWYKEYLKKSDMKKYTENQIDRFTSL